MSPKTLSLLLPPPLFPNPHPNKLLNPKTLNLQFSKPPTILCSSTYSRTHGTASSSISETRRIPSSSSGAEPDNAGAAGPSRGAIFLERYEAMSAPAKEEKKKKKTRVKSGGSLKASGALYCCYGCGAPLQTSIADSPGFVEPETFELKKKHHQLRTVLCGRCKLLSHGHMITAVGGNGGYSGGKQFISAEELREKLCHLCHEKALIVKLVDIVDFNGSFLARVRDLAGANPIILVVTKVDLLPKGTDLNCIGDWVVEATMRKKLKC